MGTNVAIALPTWFESVEAAVAWVGTAILIFAAVLWADRGPLVEMTDFSVTYIGARFVHEGRGPKLYDLAEQQRMKAALLKNAQPLIFEHPPFEALLLSPLAGLPYKTAYLIWGLFNALIWLLLPCLLRPYLPSPDSQLAYLLLWLLFPPLGIALYQGQSSLLVLLLFSVSFIALKNGREFLSGVYLGLALLKFQFVIPFVVIFLLRRKWSVVTGFLVTASTLGLLSLAAVGWRGLLSYLGLLVNVAAHPHNLSYGAANDMATLQGFLDAILGKLLNSSAVHLIGAVLSAGLIIFVAEQWRREEATHGFLDLLFAASIAIALVTSVHMFTHDLSPLILAALLAASHFPRRNRPGLRLVLGTALVILWLPPVYLALIAWHCMYLFCPILMTLALATTILATRAMDVPIQITEATAE